MSIDDSELQPLFALPDLDDVRFAFRRTDDLFLAMEKLHRQLDAMQAALINEVRASGEHRDDGHRTVSRWVQR